MRRYLVVANQTLAGHELRSTLAQLHERSPSIFHVVVPATPPTDHTWTEAEARRAARARLDAAIEALTGEGLEVTGEVGDEHPVEAVQDVLLRGGTFDAIVLSTLPPGHSRWLRRDPVRRIEAATGIRVIHVIGQRVPTSSG